ncbi:hypothetical protein SAMN05216360_10735 [Methylobacterium phyllostachyos]|uniref:Uncharacterized protein n=1 Tax=Methylobacterium phyllostachyos TaxID=582672 RepID=A0A1H0A1F9_9HYPH|nr:hypothetical protein [Methylobacterium phyllostachyos]SDN27390.1 hypothetical protein SAMN05216360_10735 [Methylobacterium phyllostachyos]
MQAADAENRIGVEVRNPAGGRIATIDDLPIRDGHDDGGPFAWLAPFAWLCSDQHTTSELEVSGVEYPQVTWRELPLRRPLSSLTLE